MLVVVIVLLMPWLLHLKMKGVWEDLDLKFAHDGDGDGDTGASGCDFDRHSDPVTGNNLTKLWFV